MLSVLIASYHDHPSSQHDAVKCHQASTSQRRDPQYCKAVSHFLCAGNFTGGPQAHQPQNSLLHVMQVMEM